jgi:hypothetical protein
VELLARPASGLDQRRLTHRNPDLRVTSIDERGAPIPAVRGAAIEKRSFADPVSIVLIENNMVARADHGMISLGGRSEEVRK